ncbi:hypothetical protein TNCV_645701 [Trichonephila clavipes]|nr:hypothetical protein TNCV_645701 [Trichonephila clavipes]
MKAFGDEPRNFEPWPSDEDVNQTRNPPPLNFHTTLTGRLSSSTDLAGIGFSTQRIFSGTNFRTHDSTIAAPYSWIPITAGNFDTQFPPQRKAPKLWRCEDIRRTEILPRAPKPNRRSRVPFKKNCSSMFQECGYFLRTD